LSIKGKDIESCSNAQQRQQMEFGGEFEIEDMFFGKLEQWLKSQTANMNI